VTPRGPHYNAVATVVVPDPHSKQLLHLISCARYCELHKIISSRLYVRLKGTCSLVGRAL